MDNMVRCLQKFVPGLQWEIIASVRKTDRAKVVTDNDKDNDKWLLPVS